MPRVDFLIGPLAAKDDSDVNAVNKRTKMDLLSLEIIFVKDLSTKLRIK